MLFFFHARIRPPGGFLPRFRLPDHYLTKIRPNGISFPGSACTTVTIPQSTYLRKPCQPRLLARSPLSPCAATALSLQAPPLSRAAAKKQLRTWQLRESSRNCVRVRAPKKGVSTTLAIQQHGCLRTGRSQAHIPANHLIACM